MPESLFTKLTSYSQNPRKRSIENFLTEVLAYLINNDRVFRRIFIRLVIPDRRMQRGYVDASALTQQTIGRGIVDLVLTGRRGRILVEVKVGAKETQTKIYGQGWVPQVRKYLSYKAGHVVYLTTRNTPSPDVNSRYFLGHPLLEQLEGRLKRERLSDTGKMLLDFMEENDMKALEPFTKRDLRNAAQAFDFSRKCEAVIDEVIRQIEPRFKKLFRIRTHFTSGHFSPTSYSAYAYTKKFRYGAVRSIFIFLQPWEGELWFGVSARVPKKDMERINRHLGWEEHRSELYSCHSVGPRFHPEALAKKALVDARALRRALNYVYY
jgi:hypothetical protein